MGYKTGRGNVAKKILRFHALVKMVSDYQGVTKSTVAASRRWGGRKKGELSMEGARGNPCPKSPVNSFHSLPRQCSCFSALPIVAAYASRHAPDYCFRGYLPSIPDRRSGGNELIRAALEVVRRYFLTRSAAAIHLLSMDKLL